jgi:hypothetical protein
MATFQGLLFLLEMFLFLVDWQLRFALLIEVVLSVGVGGVVVVGAELEVGPDEFSGENLIEQKANGLSVTLSLISKRCTLRMLSTPIPSSLFTPYPYRSERNLRQAPSGELQSISVFV